MSNEEICVDNEKYGSISIRTMPTFWVYNILGTGYLVTQSQFQKPLFLKRNQERALSHIHPQTVNYYTTTISLTFTKMLLFHHYKKDGYVTWDLKYE